MRRKLRCVLTAAVIAVSCAILLAACADDEINRGREDAGLGGMDATIDVPLQLMPGMTFTYQGIMTYRESAGAERNATWMMTLRIETVDDRGTADSALTFKVTDWMHTVDDWQAPYDFDSWVGRLGPSLADDHPSANPATASLSDVPAIPPAPTPSNPKVIPEGGTFFIDTRKLDPIRLSFLEMHNAQQPMVVDPSQNNGKLRLAFDGPDPSLVYYPADTPRAIGLEYDTRGFLTRIEETIGTASRFPSANCRITLTAGP